MTQNGSTEAQIPENAGIKVLTQYIKDLSFENPNAPESLKSMGEQPNMSVDINVNGKPLENEENIFESDIMFDATLTNKAGTLYKLELVYSGLFQFNNIDKKIVHPVLFINCPQILFPYARQIISSTTGDAGFPPLFLEPMDFGGLYAKKVEEEKAKQAASQNS